MGTLDPPRCDGGVTDPVETRSRTICVNIPNFVALGQSVWGYVRGPKNLRMLGPAPWEGASLTAEIR